jgi:ATP-binding cassette subfamily F protein 3
LLDEPTNHLDLETREALTDALAQFEGTLILVSHDRHLLRATTDQFLIVADGSMTAFDGDLDDYKDWLFKTKLAAKNQSTTEPTAQVKTPVVVAPKKSPAINPAKRKPIEARIKRLEEQMSRLNEQKILLDARLAEPALYEHSRKDELRALQEEQATCSRDLATLEAEWLEQQDSLENSVA